MKLVIGDCHGCGQELETLLDPIGPEHQIILVGDLFDRGMHGHLVLDLIKSRKIICLMGNHEMKMLKFLKGERTSVPPHYEWAIRNLEKHGVSKTHLIGFLDALPLMLRFDKFGQQIDVNRPLPVDAGDTIITHAGVNPYHPLDQDKSWTVYGGGMKPAKHWFDIYAGPAFVIYGHLSEMDKKPRVRPYSLGIDTAAVHGGPLTGVWVETREIISTKSGIDWFTKLGAEMKK